MQATTQRIKPAPSGDGLPSMSSTKAENNSKFAISITEPEVKWKEDSTGPGWSPVSEMAEGPDIATASASTSLSRMANITPAIEVSTSQCSLRQAQTSLFLSLVPPDIHHLLLTSNSYLEWSDLTSLRLTCRYFAQSIPPVKLAQLHQRIITDYLHAEHFRLLSHIDSLCLHRSFLHRFHTYGSAMRYRPTQDLRCYGCLQLKPLTSFTEGMTTKGLGLGAKRAHGRLCKVCMIDRGRVRWGAWERENWVEKRNVVRMAELDGDDTSRRKRWARVFSRPDALPMLQESRAMKPDTEYETEIGVCARCRQSPYELYWGCRDCFEKEELARQEADREELSRPGVGELGAAESWTGLKSKWRAWRGPKGNRYHRWVWIWNEEFWDAIREKREQKIKRNAREQQRRRVQRVMCNAAAAMAKDDLQADIVRRCKTTINVARREVRCISCWTPNCLRRRWALGLAFETPLEKSRWCQGCVEEQAEMLERRAERRVEAALYRDVAETGDSMEGIAGLFG